MNMRINDKPIVTFSCLSVSAIQGRNNIIEDKGNVVTFHAYMPSDKNKMTYTFNAFDDVRERVIKMNLKKGSRIMIVAALKNYISKDNVCRQSFTVCLIDYLPADDNQFVVKPDNKSGQQPQAKQPSTYSSATATNYQRQNLQQPATPQRKQYSCEQPEVDIDEFANAIGSM